jgi:hypothetical protein
MPTRDSAGVKISAHPSPADLPQLPWQLTGFVVEFGGSEREQARPLYQITGATRLASGQVVVASAGTHELRFYGTKGGAVNVRGRAGQGPGEFQSLMWVGGLPGDSVAAWDPGLGRMSVFDSIGRFVRAFAPSGLRGIFPQVQGVLQDGRVILAVGGDALPAPGRALRDTLTYLVLSTAGTVADTLGHFLGTELIALRDPAGGMLIRPLPFGRRSMTAVRGEQVYVNEGNSYEIRAYVPGRGLRAIVRADHPPLQVTAADIQAYRQQLVTLGAGADAEANRKQEQLLKEAPYPASMPPIASLVLDSDGNLWVQETQRPGDFGASRWAVFTPEGEALGTLRLPRDLRIFEIGTDWILGMRLDDEQVEHLELHQLAR